MSLTRIFRVLVLVCPLFGQGADPAPLLQESAGALQRGDFPVAEQKLREALKLQPANPDVLSLLGYALDGQRKFSEAGPLHRRAVERAPDSAAVIGRYAHHLLSSGDEAGAREAYRKAATIDPADPYTNLQLARLLLKKEPASALTYIDRMPSNRQELPEVAVVRLAALQLSGNRAAADAVAARLVAASAKDSNLSGTLASTMADAGLYDRAEEFLTQALALEPSNFRLLYNLGVVAVYARRFERAREVLEIAVRQQPYHVDTLYSLAFTYNALKQTEDTLRLAARAARLAPQRADLQRLIAVTASELRASEDAAAAWERYVALAPHDDAGRRELGFARIHLRQFESGIADLEWYIARHPDDPVAHYELGLGLSTDDPTKGLASLDRALALKPDFVAARAARGALSYVQGKAEAAVPDLEAAAAAEPSNGLILDRLGQAYRALDRLPDAIRVLRKAAELAPAEATIQLHLGSALSEAGQNAEADALMARYRHMRPSQAPRGLMNYLSLTPEQQRADYRARVEKAVRDNPGDASAHVHYLKLSLEEGRMEQASATARTIASLKAGAAVMADAGRALLEAHQYASASELLEKAAATDSSSGLELEIAIAVFRTKGAAEGIQRIARVPDARRNADYYLARAQMSAASGKTGDAMQSMEKAVAVAPRRPDLYWQLAMLLEKDGRGDESLKLLDQAEKLLPQDYQIPLIQAVLLDLAGKMADAERKLEQVQRRWPDRAAVWVARGALLAARGQAEESRRALETAVSLGARSPEARALTVDRNLLKTRPPQDW